MSEENKTVELKDEDLEKINGGSGNPLSNRSTIDEVEEGMSVFAFDSVNLLHRWGTVVRKHDPSIEVSFGGGVAYVNGEPKQLIQCTVTLQEFWLSPSEF